MTILEGKRMKIIRLCWVGTRTARFESTVSFFRDVLRLPVLTNPGDFTVFAVPDGSTVEVFGPQSAYNEHLTVPTVGFEVENLAAADEELRAAGVEIVLPITGGDERVWLHFRAPDGHVYELLEIRN